uniref:NADH dehydrogenase subunit 6 n=1 Tax=Cheiloneurus chinensis TaxID=3082044 RepID=UPI002A7F6EA4|nr:NADH dehydrogenase subunit 6 [Cheiloneurus chinensis]WOE90958.1 NADH dehydrogenase subunit 6 [Cheiloneurus chinensis]
MMNYMNMSMYMIINMPMMLMMINSIPSYYKTFHPLILGSILMLMNLITSMNISIYLPTNWWSYIIFLIMVGGLMILFMYFTSFINNMIISLKYYLFKNLMFKSLLMLIYIIMINMKFNNYMIWNSNINKFDISQDWMITKMKNFTMMYLYNLNYSMMISIIYLLISLFLIVKMIIINKFSLRKMN